MSGYLGVERGEELEKLFPGCGGSAVIFPACFLPLKLHRSRVQGRLGALILCAFLMTHCSLFLSYSVADPNHTAIEEHNEWTGGFRSKIGRAAPEEG